MNKLWFALQALGFAREKGLMNKRVLIALAAVSVPVRAVDALLGERDKGPAAPAAA